MSTIELNTAHQELALANLPEIKAAIIDFNTRGSEEYLDPWYNYFIVRSTKYHGDKSLYLYFVDTVDREMTSCSPFIVFHDCYFSADYLKALGAFKRKVNHPIALLNDLVPHLNVIPALIRIQKIDTLLADA